MNLSLICFLFTYLEKKIKKVLILTSKDNLSKSPLKSENWRLSRVKTLSEVVMIGLSLNAFFFNLDKWSLTFVRSPLYSGFESIEFTKMFWLLSVTKSIF
jgi:hypothetical protein